MIKVIQCSRKGTKFKEILIQWKVTDELRRDIKYFIHFWTYLPWFKRVIYKGVNIYGTKKRQENEHGEFNPI